MESRQAGDQKRSARAYGGGEENSHGQIFKAGPRAPDFKARNSQPPKPEKNKKPKGGNTLT